MTSEVSLLAPAPPHAPWPARCQAWAARIARGLQLSLLPEALTSIPPSVLPPFKVPPKFPFKSLPVELQSLVADSLAKDDVSALSLTCGSVRRALQHHRDRALAPHLHAAGCQIMYMAPSPERQKAARHYVGRVASLAANLKDEPMIGYARELALEHAARAISQGESEPRAARDWSITDQGGLFDGQGEGAASRLLKSIRPVIPS